MLRVRCPGCGQTLHIHGPGGRRRIKCKLCKHVFPRPAGEAAAAGGPEAAERGDAGWPRGEDDSGRLARRPRSWVPPVVIACSLAAGAAGLGLAVVADRAVVGDGGQYRRWVAPILFAVGTFAVAVAKLNWKWFLRGWRYTLARGLIGRGTAEAGYVLTGLTMLLAGSVVAVLPMLSALAAVLMQLATRPGD
jgi:hypothetical protein